MEKPTLLLLTNFHHSPIDELEEEDIFLAHYLRKEFNVIMSHPLDCEVVEDSADIVFIRNVWPIFSYEKEWEIVKSRFLKKKLNTHPQLTGRGDLLGKNHVLELFRAGVPVIPSIDTVKDLSQLPEQEYYAIKPKNSCDAIGFEKLTKKEVLAKNPKNHIIQPFIDFEYEVSFYILDNELLSSFFTLKKVGTYKIQEYTPTKKDLAFVNCFVDWNNVPI